MANAAQSGSLRRRRGRQVDTAPLIAPVVLPLVVWAFVPLAVTLWFSLLHYNLLDPITRFVGFNNYSYLLTDPSLLDALWNTLALVVGVLAASIVFGCLFAILFDQEFYGRSVARLLIIMPFATLILLTAIQSLDREQVEAARMDGAKRATMFYFIVLPHLARPITVIIM